jgi:hypothetical protein
MSENDAVLPSFMTCADSLALSWSDSWFFALSTFSTLPVTCWPALAELPVPPIAPDEPEELDPVPPSEPESDELDDPPPIEPDEPAPDFDGSEDEPDEPAPDFDGSEDDEPDEPLPIEPDEPEDPDEPVEPEDPDEPVEPEDPDEPVEPEDPVEPVEVCAPAGSAMSRPATPRPATIPLVIFMWFPPDFRWRRTRHPAQARLLDY